VSKVTVSNVVVITSGSCQIGGMVSEKIDWPKRVRINSQQTELKTPVTLQSD